MPFKRRCHERDYTRKNNQKQQGCKSKKSEANGWDKEALKTFRTKGQNGQNKFFFIIYA